MIRSHLPSAGKGHASPRYAGMILLRLGRKSPIANFSPLCGDDPIAKNFDLYLKPFSPLCGDDPK